MQRPLTRWLLKRVPARNSAFRPQPNKSRLILPLRRLEVDGGSDDRGAGGSWRRGMTFRPVLRPQRGTSGAGGDGLYGRGIWHMSGPKRPGTKVSGPDCE